MQQVTHWLGRASGGCVLVTLPLAWIHEILHRHGPRAVLSLERGLTILLIMTYGRIIAYMCCAVPTANVTSCPADFIQPVGTTSCYKVVSPTLSDVTESRDYVQATTACQSDGAHLVSIESVDEQRHLATILRTQPGQCMM